MTIIDGWSLVIVIGMALMFGPWLVVMLTDTPYSDAGCATVGGLFIAGLVIVALGATHGGKIEVVWT